MDESPLTGPQLALLQQQQARQAAEQAQQQRDASDRWYQAHYNEHGVPLLPNENTGTGLPETGVPRKATLIARAEAERSHAEAIWNQTHNASNPYRGASVNQIIERRTRPFENSARFRALNAEAAQRQNSIVSSSGVEIGGTFVSGPNRGMRFTTTQQDNAARQAQLDDALAKMSTLPTAQTEIRATFNVPTAPRSGPLTGWMSGLLGGFSEGINRYMAMSWDVNNRLSGFSPIQRASAYADATSLTAMEATYIGKGAAPKYSLVPGSASDRFAHDEYGRVLRSGEKFSPAYNNTGIPYNSKMGSGDYVYVGEYLYGTGETVSRYYETSVGSFFDVSMQGRGGPIMPGVRSGGGPGSYYESNRAPAAVNAGVPAGAARGGGFGDILGGFATAMNINVFQNIPVFRDINRAGRIVGIDRMTMGLTNELTKSSESYDSQIKVYEKHVNTYKKAGGSDEVFRGSPAEYQKLQGMYDQLNREHAALTAEGNALQAGAGNIANLQQEKNQLSAELTAGGNPVLDFFLLHTVPVTKGIYDWSVGAQDYYKKNVGDPVSDYIKNNSGHETRTEVGASLKSLLISMEVAAIQAPGQTLGFAGMIPSGAVTVARNPTMLPAFAMAGLAMQAQSIEEGLRTRPAEFLTEQAVNIALFHYAGKGLKAINPIGFGVAEIPSFEKGVGSKYYMAYLKKPFSAMESGGKSLGGFARIRTPTNEIFQYLGAESLEMDASSIAFRKTIGTFNDVGEAQRYFNDVAMSGKRMFLHATGDTAFVEDLISNRKVIVGEKTNLGGNALFFAPPDTLYTRFLTGKGAKLPGVGGGILRITTDAKITSDYLLAAERVARGELTPGGAAKTLPGGMYPSFKPYSGVGWRGILQREFLVPEKTQLNVTGTHWMEIGGKKIPLVDVTMNPALPDASGWAASRLSTIFDPAIETRFFLGSPAKVMRTHDINIGSPFAMEKQWTRATFAAMNSLIMESPPSMARTMWESVPAAIEASQSRFYHPVQRELMGEFPTPAAGWATMEDIYGVAETRGKDLITGGSRTIKAWTGEYGRGASLQDIDFWTYKAKMKATYDDMLSVVERDYPGSSKQRYTYLDKPGQKPGFSIVTGKDYFLSAHRVETFPFVKEGVVPLKTIGGHTVWAPSPQKSLRMKTSGMFASIQQKAGGEVEFTPMRVKDIVDAYSLSRTIAHDLYTPVNYDIGGIITRHKLKQTQALVDFSVNVKVFADAVGGAEGQSMLKEIPNTGAIFPNGDIMIQTAGPAPVHDLLTGRGIVGARYEGLYQRSIAAAGAVGVSLMAPEIGIPKAIGAVVGVTFWDDLRGFVKGRAPSIDAVHDAFTKQGQMVQNHMIPAEDYPVIVPERGRVPAVLGFYPAVKMKPLYHTTPLVKTVLYPILSVAMKYPTVKVVRTVYPLAKTTSGYPEVKYPTKPVVAEYPVYTPPPTPKAYNTYIPPPPKPTVPPYRYNYVPPARLYNPYPLLFTNEGQIRRRKKKRRRKAQEWMIFNPVPDYWTIFEGALNIKTVTPKVNVKTVKAPTIKMPKMRVMKWKM